MNDRILPLGAFALALAIFFGYVTPLWNGQIAEANAAIAQDSTALDSAAQYVARQNQLAAEQAAIDPTALARLATFLPDSVDNVGLILDINALAARSGLALTTIDVDAGASTANTTAASLPSAAPNPVGNVDLTLSASGSYSSLETFLYGLEHSERLLDVRDLTVKGSTTGVYTYQMTVRIYWLR